MGSDRRHHGACETFHCRLRCIHRQDTKRGNVLQSVHNLLDNRVRYTPPGGQVAISSKRRHDGSQILFCNSGPDIPSDDPPFIFEHFLRTDRSHGRDADSRDD